MIKTVIKYQYVYTAMAIGFLICSGVVDFFTGSPLSVANVPVSITLFTTYCFLIYKYSTNRRVYLTTMVFAILLFCLGGVFGNLHEYFTAGLENYYNLPIFILAVSINAFGSIFNIIALALTLKNQGPDAPI